MGINFTEIAQCTNKCDCCSLGNVILKESHTSNKNSAKKKENIRNSRHNKDNYIMEKFFSNKIIDYLNESKKEDSLINNNNNNNLGTFRSTNIQSNYNERNNNENHHYLNISKNNICNKNNITVEKKDKDSEDSSIYSNKDSFIKMEERNREDSKKFDKSLIQVSNIEYSLENKEKSQIDIDYNNINFEELVNLIETKNVENDGTIIELNGEGCIFKGKLEDKKNICGKGKMYYKDGRKYEGNFKNGKLNGKGKYTTNNGVIYEGIFNNGNLSGKGNITKFVSISQEDKSQICQEKEKNYKIEYEGEIKDFKREGKGKEKTSEYQYDGDFHNDMKNGKGISVFFNSGDKYEGEFRDDKITGHGKYIWNNKNIYEGEFFDGKMHGKGIYKWPEGNEYEGEYNNNIREGKGRFRWKNGIIFEGNFIKGKPEGRGKMIYNNNKKDVEYKNGNIIGNFQEIINRLMNKS